MKQTSIKGIFEYYDNGLIESRYFLATTARRVQEIFRISYNDARNIFLFEQSSEMYYFLKKNPHAVTKAMILKNIDLAIEGKPTINYRDMIINAKV